MKKMLICLIACMFLVSMTAVVTSDNIDVEITIEARKYVENRPIVPVFTEDGLEYSINEKAPGEKKGKPPGKPGKPPKDPPQGNGEPDGQLEKWALCIGISDYQGTGSDLQYCDDDAMDWKSFLVSQGYTVKTLTNKKAKANNIQSEVIKLLANEDGDDHVVFTYSGHGLDYQSYGSCIISHDFYAMSHGWLKSLFDGANASHIYFAFDACEIGDFSDSVTSGRVGAFASNNQLSYDGDSSMKNGVFTYYQMEGWDTYTSFEDDANYAINGMENWAIPYGINVDPFLTDHYSGDMTP